MLSRNDGTPGGGSLEGGHRAESLASAAPYRDHFTDTTESCDEPGGIRNPRILGWLFYAQWTAE